MAEECPALNVVIHNAGIMQVEDWRTDEVDLSTAEATITTNLLAPIRLSAALLPQLKRHPLRFAAEQGYEKYMAQFHAFNDTFGAGIKG